MKALSIWNPFAALLVKGFKIFETRTWAPPASLIGQRIAIASTKTILPAQRAHWADPEFLRFYENTGLPAPEELPRGYILGHVRLDSFELMDEEMMDDVSLEEQAYGWWEPGNYAWRMVDPVEIAHPIPVRGAQGIWNLPEGMTERVMSNADPINTERIPHLRPVDGSF